MSLASAFTTAVMPIIAVAVVGYIFASVYDIDIEPVNTVGLYIMIPALAFHSIATTPMGGGEIMKLSLGVVAYALVMVVIAGAVGKAIGTSETLLGALMLASAFPNSGFIGIPLSEFAFGEVGGTTAVLYLTVQNVVVYTLGVYIASSGTERNSRDAVLEIFRLPLIYAVVAAVALRGLGLMPPDGGATIAAVMDTIKIVGDASIPLMLLIVGMKLAETDVQALSKTVTPTVLKLGVAPVVAFGLAILLGFDDLTVARTFIIESATPAATIPLALLIEYQGDVETEEITPAEYLSTVIFVTTILSVVVLTVLVYLLRAGMVM
ncbi:MAG: AEC family transporter [Halanaeroarchaeum sp.]